MLLLWATQARKLCVVWCYSFSDCLLVWIKCKSQPPRGNLPLASLLFPQGSQLKYCKMSTLLLDLFSFSIWLFSHFLLPNIYQEILVKLAFSSACLLLDANYCLLSNWPGQPGFDVRWDHCEPRLSECSNQITKEVSVAAVVYHHFHI